MRDFIRREQEQLQRGGSLGEAVTNAQSVLRRVRLAVATTQQENEDLPELLTWLGELHRRGEDFLSAHRVFEQAAAARSQLHGANDWRVTDARLAVKELERVAALSAGQRERLKSADNLIEQAIAVMQEPEDDKASGEVPTITQYQEWMRRREERQQQRYQQVLAILNKASVVYRELLGQNDRRYLSVVEYLAQLSAATGDEQGEISLREQLVSRRAAVLGVLHPHSVLGVLHLASYYRESGSAKSAEQTLNRIVQPMTRVDWHGLTAGQQEFLESGLEELAELRQERSGFADARSAWKQLLDVRRAKYGQDHWKVRDAQLQLDGLQKRTSLTGIQLARLDDASALLQQVRQLQKARRQDDALRLALQVSETRKEILGENDVAYAESLGLIAALRLESGDTPGAITVARRREGLLIKLVGQLHPSYQDTLAQLAASLAAGGQEAEAALLWKKAVVLRDKLEAMNRPPKRRADLERAPFDGDGKTGPIAASPPAISHDFERDSRSDYYVGGDVAWMRGKITLERDALIMKPLNAGQRVEVALKLDWPELKEGERAAIQVTFVAGDPFSSAVIGRRREGNRLRGTIQIVRTRGFSEGENGSTARRPDNVVVRSVAYDPQGQLDTFSVLYNRALVSVSTTAGKLAAGCPKTLSHDVRSVILAASAGPVSVAELQIRGDPPDNRFARRPRPPGPVAEQADALDSRARDLNIAGRQSEAIPLAERALTIQRDTYGEDNRAYVKGLDLLASLYAGKGHHEKAQSHYEKSLKIRERLARAEKLRYADAVEALAEFSNPANEPPDKPSNEMMIRLIEETLQRHCSVYGEDNLECVTKLERLGKHYAATGQHEKVKPLYERALLAGKQIGQEDLEFAQAIESLAEQCDQTGQREKATQLYERALGIYRRLFGETGFWYLFEVAQLAKRHRAMGDYDQAESLFRTVLAIQQRTLSESHPVYAETLHSLALLYGERGDFAEAESYLRQAQQIRETVLGTSSRDFIRGLRGLSGLHLAQGEFDKAETSLRRALEILKSAFGEWHPDYVDLLDEMRNLCLVVDKYAEAISLGEKICEIDRLEYGRVGTVYPISLDKLGLLHEMVGEYAKAEARYLEALRVREEVYGEHNLACATSLLRLGNLYRRVRRFDEASQRLERAQEIIRDALGAAHPDYAASLIVAANIQLDQGDLAAAESLCDQAVTVFREQELRSEPAYHFVLSSLGRFYQLKGDFAEAESCYRNVNDLRRRILGEHGVWYAQGLRDLAELYLISSRRDDAVALLRKALDIERSTVRRNIGLMPESQAMAFAAREQDSCNLLLSAYRELPGTDSRKAYAEVWRKRARVTRVLAERRRLLSDSPKAQQIFTQLKTTRQRLAQLTLSKTADERLAFRRQMLAELTAEKERLETELARLSDDFHRLRLLRDAEIPELAARLPPEVAVVDVVHTTYWHRRRENDRMLSPSREYDAFVIRKSQADPGYTVAWLHLGPADAINKLVARARRSFRFDADENGGNAGSPEKARQRDPPQNRLRAVIWNRLEPHLDGCKTVLIVPDQDLCFLPWAALPGREPGSFLIEDYAIATATSGQQVLELLNGSRNLHSGLLLVGGVAYDEDASLMPPVREQTSPKEAGDGFSGSTRAAVDRGSRPSWSALPGALAEVETIKGLWGHRDSVTLLRDAIANENAARRHLCKTRYVHLATHGFFADQRYRAMFPEDVTEQQFDADRVLVADEQVGAVARNPMILSGVVLAAANLPPKTNWLGLPTGEDGILTAEEVINIDLRGCDLAVLSACDTGLGKVGGNEGVMGLQRAFHLGGAATVVTSLWQVDDAATKNLMVEFYKNLWRKNLGKLEALRQAQLAMLERYDPQEERLRGAARLDRPQKTIDSAGRLPPRYWAGFVLSGDWR